MTVASKNFDDLVDTMHNVYTNQKESRNMHAIKDIKRSKSLNKHQKFRMIAKKCNILEKRERECTKAKNRRAIDLARLDKIFDQEFEDRTEYIEYVPIDYGECSEWDTWTCSMCPGFPGYDRLLEFNDF